MKFKHREHEIVVDPKTGQFRSGAFTASSLAAIKRKLDDATKFAPYKALTFDPHLSDKPIREVTVVGLRRRQQWGQTFTEFLTQERGGVKKLYAATAENRRLLRQALTMTKRFRKLRVEHDRAVVRLLDKATQIEPE